ncbi:MAG TPA: EfeM/EfeO family lipoprotein [Labilithrix sp.]|nr:EfeM/EfeO family lipoprotein [Labilithrix sp.]
MRPLRAVLCAALLAACSSSESSPPATAPDSGTTPPVTTPPLDDAAQKTKAVQEMHDVLLVDVKTLADAALEIQNAAPTPAGRGWDKTDAAALATMRASWLKARTAYEHIEGALAPLFPDIDVAIDARYDDFLADLVGKGGDPYLFDDQGVIGMHAVERILFADNIPVRVVEFEKALPGYVAAAAPATAQEAADFKNKLCAKLVADTKRLTAEWTPAKIDVRIAYAGLVALVAEQEEKVKKAATGEEESRYSQRTMNDLRDNLDGTKKVYAIFQPWLTSKASPSADLDKSILAGLAALDASYKAVTGEAIPEPPATWSAESPSAADLQTPFGKLYTAVTNQADASKSDSVVSKLGAAGVLLGFPATN